MIQTLKKQSRVMWRDWMWQIVLIFGMGLFGIILYQIILAFVNTDEVYVPVGAIIAAFTAVVFSAALVMSQIKVYFNAEISMGCTRRHFLPTFFLFTLAESMLGVGMVLLVSLAENALNKALHPQLKVVTDVFSYLLRWSVPAMLALVSIALFLGAMVIRFGKRAYWVLWGVWMVLCIGFPRVMDAMESAPNSVFGKIGTAIVGFATKVPAGMWGVGSIVVCVVGVVGAYLFLRRQQVMG